MSINGGGVLIISYDRWSDELYCNGSCTIFAVSCSRNAGCDPADRTIVSSVLCTTINSEIACIIGCVPQSNCIEVNTVSLKSETCSFDKKLKKPNSVTQYGQSANANVGEIDKSGKS